MVSLPYELLGEIASHVQRNHLPSLALTSRTFQHASEPHLYNTLSSADLTPGRLCRALLQLPKRDRGSHLRRLSLDLPKWTRPQRRLLRAFAALLTRALAASPSLQTLVLLGFSDVPDAGRLLRDCRAQPRTFISDMPATPVLSEWLRWQTMLDALVLATKTPPSEPLDVGPGAMPRLRTICAHGSILRVLVPGRPVEHIAQDVTLEREHRDADLDAAVTRAYTQSTAPLRTLGIQYRPSADGEEYVIWPECVPFSEGEGGRLENVTHLEFYVPTFHYFEAFDAIGPLLDRFPGLQSLEIAGGHLFGMFSTLDMRTAAGAWRAQCRTLTQVVFRDRADVGRHEGATKLCAFEWDERAKTLLPREASLVVRARERTSYEEHADMLIKALRR